MTFSDDDYGKGVLEDIGKAYEALLVKMIDERNNSSVSVIANQEAR